MKFLSTAILCMSCGLAWAQTNPPARNPADQQVEIDSDSGFFDGITYQIVYTGHVFVTDFVKARLHCERLTVDLPPDGGHPTNILAETNVAVDIVDGKGQTNHITADRAIYTYQLLNPVTNLAAIATSAPHTVTNIVYAITNEAVAFSGHATNTSAQGWFTGEPLVWDNIKGRFDFGSNVTMHIKLPASGSGTNAARFDFMK